MPPMLPKPANVSFLIWKNESGKKEFDGRLTNLPSCTNGSSVMSAQVHVEPTHNDWHGRIAAHGDEEERAVLDIRVVMDIEQDGKARDGHENTENGEGEPVLDPIGYDGDRHGEAKGGDPGENGAQLDLDRIRGVGADDGGREVGVAVGRDNHAKVHEAAEPDAVILHNVEGVLEGDGTLGSVVTLVGGQLGHEIGALILLEEAGLFREGGEREPEDNGSQSGDDTLEDEDPSPAAVATHVVHLANAVRQQTAESSGKRGGREEERVALLGLISPVPHAEEVEATGEHAALEETKQEASSEQTGIVLHQTLADGDDTEPKTADGQPNTRGELLHQDVGRNLEDDVRDEEDGQSRVVLNTSQVEIRLESESAGIADVDTVQESQEIENDQEGDDIEVNLQGQPPVACVGRTDKSRRSVVCR